MNLAVKNLILGVGEYVIRHPNIRAREVNLYRFDGTHLSNVGINVYLNTIQGALEIFCCRLVRMFFLLLNTSILSDISW